MSETAMIVGCAGLALSPDELAFFAEARPWGLILFARNCGTPEQISTLTTDFRSAVGRDNAPVLIDQEGGRVQRMGPPHWRAYPAGARFGELYARDPQAGLRALRASTRLMAHDLHAVGINVDCVPVLDVRQADAHDVIGDRAYGYDPGTVATLGRIVAETMLDAGVLPVVKHVPGHGRAAADSHKSLPVVDAGAEALRSCDFAPFADLNDAPLAMTAHVVYEAFDREQPATLSKPMIDLIRGEIAFDGALMTDDLNMGALSGTVAERSGAALAAGCDLILHCNGDLAQMRELAEHVPVLAGAAAERCARALDRLRPPALFDVDDALRELDAITGESV